VIGLLQKVINLVAELVTATSKDRPIPEPYLRVPFRVADYEQVPVLAGWHYDADEIAIHGINYHGAIDWALSLGSPVLAAADGYAVAFWDERWLTETTEAGEQPRLLNGQPMTFGQGLTVQIYHGRGRYTQYGHLSGLSEMNIPFYDSVLDEQGNRLPHTIRTELVREYQRAGVARKVKAGDMIGFVGVTGGAIGAMSYDRWKQIGTSFKPGDYPTYMDPHLHFVEFGRSLKSRHPLRRDPFGLYATAENYPSDLRLWPQATSDQRHHPLWLPI
jgi:hypothetical protein